MEPLYPTATATAVETGKGIVTQQYVPVVLLVPSVLLVYLSLIFRREAVQHCRLLILQGLVVKHIFDTLACHELSHLHFSRSGERESDIRHNVRGEEEEEEVVRLKNTDAKSESDSPTADKPAVTPKGILHRLHRLRRSST